MTGSESAPGDGGECLRRTAEIELLENFRGSVGENGRDEDGDDAADFSEVVEDFVEARGLSGIFGEFERSGLIDVLIGASDQRPDAGECVLDFVLLVMGASFANEFSRLGLEFVRDGGNDSFAVAVEHRERTIEKIAEAVGEFGAVTRGETGVGPIAVGTDIEFAGDVIAERIEAPFLNDGDGVDDVAGGFADFLAVLLPPAVDEELFGEREAHCFEHDRPIDGVEFEDVFADDVNFRGPERMFLLKAGLRMRENFFRGRAL